jgi:hypothetical protein
MTVRVIWDDPRTFGARTMMRGLAGIAGGVLATTGRVATPVLAVAGIALVSSDPADPLGAVLPAGLAAAPTWIIAVLVATAAWLVGVWLMRSHRRLVVFLRRFRYSPATSVVTYATRGIGATWRLVTLDDAEIEPVGVGGPPRLVLLAARAQVRLDVWSRPLLPRAILIAVLGGVLSVAGGFYVGSVADPPPWAWWLLAAPAATALGTTVLILIWVLARLGMDVLEEVVEPLEDIDKTKVLTADGLVGVESAVERVSRQSRQMITPRLTVLTVESAVWREMVSALCAVASAAVVDVSEPTEQVLWEIAELARHPRLRPLFLIHADRLNQLNSPALVSILDGREVLGYTSDPDGHRRFTRLLRARLESPTA